METTENKAVVNTDTSTTTTGTTTKCPEYKLINLRKGPGRPKGTKNKPVVGMPINKRLKLLSKIAMNKNTKPTDVINAVKEITALLNDFHITKRGEYWTRDMVKYIAKSNR
jgi:hypothetical protein